jgi:hypothetical protein
MVGKLAARHALPKEVVDGVTERTGGVPLFVVSWPSSCSTWLDRETTRPASSKRTEPWDKRSFFSVSLRPRESILSKRLLATNPQLHRSSAFIYVESMLG